MVYHWFFYAKSFNSAQTYCQSRVNGGNLASFISQDKIEAIIKVLPRSRIAWTGLCCKKLSKSWSFIDGTDTAFALSLLQSPACASGTCVKIHKDGTLQSVSCDFTGEFVCQTSQRLLDPTNLAGSSGK